MADSLEFTVLPDGRARVITDEISMAQHLNSEQLLKFLAQLTGGPAKRTARTDVKKGDHKHHHHQKS